MVDEVPTKTRLVGVEGSESCVQFGFGESLSGSNHPARDHAQQLHTLVMVRRVPIDGPVACEVSLGSATRPLICVLSQQGEEAAFVRSDIATPSLHQSRTHQLVEDPRALRRAHSDPAGIRLEPQNDLGVDSPSIGIREEGDDRTPGMR